MMKMAWSTMMRSPSMKMMTKISPETHSRLLKKLKNIFLNLKRVISARLNQKISIPSLDRENLELRLSK
jgi:hypothetical protein